ncbi:hypothetical protein [Cochlodiniinecator piscidefendens]|uniref:hypothetical protein n=1 Tax=Cochlodiniinecator piscidefendens TaxID=2715756 RepID=UPI001409177B|nr:hypothetical protein [Cochlodiniinecator piscidefendens]
MQHIVETIQIEITQTLPSRLHGHVCFCFSDGSRTGFMCNVPLTNDPKADHYALEAEGLRQLQRMPEYRSGQTTLIVTSKLMAS